MIQIHATATNQGVRQYTVTAPGITIHTLSETDAQHQAAALAKHAPPPPPDPGEEAPA